ncbi:MAG TPA: hypothetical protein VFZ61_06170, partial [Polyangiales bacterium]
MKNFGFASLLILVCACADQRAGSEAPETRVPPGANSGSPNPLGAGTGADRQGAVGGSTSPATPAAGSPGADPDAVPTTREPALAPRTPARDGLVVHEWGTFTSVAGSSGALLEGLHHEEEALPGFVYGRSRLDQPLQDAGMKSMETLPTGVTQKLETPVLYFYGAAQKGLRVRVDFPTGVVSQWYPRATGFGPAMGTVTVPKDGFMEWAIDLDPSMSSREFPAVS